MNRFHLALIHLRNYFLSIGDRCCLNISDELVVSNSESSAMVNGSVKIDVVAVAVDVAGSVGVTGSINGSSFVANFPVEILRAPKKAKSEITIRMFSNEKSKESK